jgi:beta-N-acetylhexosaminidase
MNRNPPRVVLVMGPTGSGKTTVGTQLAAELGARFLDADDFCPLEARAKMAAGIALGDADRWPWLERLNRELHAASAPLVVLACSAQTERYRAVLLAGLPDRRIVCLRGTAELLRARMEGRAGHFMPVSLLPSQLALMEPPAEGLVLDAAQPLDAVVAAARSYVAGS